MPAGYALTFDGVSQYADGGNINSVDHIVPFSMSGIIKSTGAATGTIMGKTNDVAPNEGYKLLMHSTGKLIFGLKSTSAQNIEVDSGAVVVNDGNKHFVAVTYDCLGLAAGLKIYIDGVEVTANPTGGPITGGTIINAAVKFCLGARNDVGSFWPGTIDEPVFYSGSILGIKSVRYLYDAGRGMYTVKDLPCPTTQYWHCDEGAGAVVASGMGAADLALPNGAAWAAGLVTVPDKRGSGFI